MNQLSSSRIFNDLSEGAIEYMQDLGVQPNPAPMSDFRVQVRSNPNDGHNHDPTKFLSVIIFDRRRSAEGLIMLERAGEPSISTALFDRNNCVIVTGFVSSPSNRPRANLIILTRWHVSRVRQYPLCVPKKHLRNKAVQGGTIAQLLHTRLSYLTNEEMRGGCPKSSLISNAIQQYQANMVLVRQSSVESASTHAKETFAPALDQFKKTQRERLKSTLISHTSPEDPEHVTRVYNNYCAAFDEAMAQAQNHEAKIDVTKWHRTICNGLIYSAGVIRRKNVKAGMVKFTAYQDLNTQMESLMNSFALLRERLEKSSKPDFVLFASIVLFAINDMHPFEDGNGRLARLCCNFVLCKSGTPFPILLFVNQEQRKELCAALEMVRCNLNLISRGESDSDIVHDCIRGAGGFAPLVRLVQDRMEKTIEDFNKLVNEKSSSAAEQEQLRAARRHRELQQTQSCPICFDDNPNISMLCCGTAVHFNCMATWLSSNQSCPSCRGELPRLPAATPPPDQSEEHESDEDETSDFHIPWIVHEIMANAHRMEQEQPAGGDFNFDEEETTSFDSGLESGEEETTTTDYDEDEDEEMPPDYKCTYPGCNNLRANGCQASMCGRCCQQTRRFICHRHGVE